MEVQSFAKLNLQEIAKEFLNFAKVAKIRQIW